MKIDKWVGPYKVYAFPWIDGKRIYFNVQYYAQGKSIEQPPVWDKTVYITDNDAGRQLVFYFTDTLIKGVARLQIAKNTVVVLTA